MAALTENKKKLHLILVLGLVLLAGFLGMSVTSYFVCRANLHKNIIERELPMASDTIHSEIQRLLLPPLNISATMANSVFVRDWILGGEQDVDKISEYLEEIQQNQDMVSAFLISEASKNYYSHKGLRGPVDDEGDDVWYRRCRDGKMDFEINADLDMHVSNRLKLFINYKVFDRDGEFLGITGVATRTESIEALIQRYRASYHKTIYFVRPSGEIAFLVDDRAGPVQSVHLADYVGSDELAEELLSQPVSTTEYRRNGNDVLLSARFLPELQWYLMVEESVDAGMVYLHRIWGMNLIVCLVLTAVVLTSVSWTVSQYQKLLVKKNKRLERMSQEKDSFTKMVVHDLKTPVGGIVGMARLILCEKDPALIQEYAADIEVAGNEMVDGIQALLDLKAIETAAQPTLEALNLLDVFAGERSKWDSLAGHKRMTLRIDAGEDPMWILAHRAWVALIADNFVSNAVKYSPEGAQVTVRLEERGARVRLWVEDEGPGIFPEERDQLFKQFSRLSTRPTGGESSSGLGLYIAKEVVCKMGGDIGVESEPGHGSRFWAEFPAADNR